MRMSLLVVKGDTTYDMTSLVESVTWSGSKSSAPRSVDINMLDSDVVGHDRPDIEVEKGNQCAFYWDGKERFRGIIMRLSQTHKRMATIKAYDNAIYLANNSDTFVYKNKTGTQIFTDICSRFGLEYTAVDTDYKISKLTMPNTTCIDAIWSALAKTYRATGKRFYVLSQEGKLNLISRADNLVQWVLEEGANITSFTRDVSIEEVKTRVKIFSDANKVVAEAKDEAIEAYIGVLQHAEGAKDKLKKAKLKEMAKTLLDEMKNASESFTIEGLGTPEVYSGVAIWVNVPYLGITKTYYVDEDKHTFKGESHTMSLTLNAVADVEGADDDDDEEK